jgi:hypothetical protein
VAKQGLFAVTDGIYQVRGYDLSNISFVEGDNGVLVIDPLASTESRPRPPAMRLYRQHRGDWPVVAVIYTHSYGMGVTVGAARRDQLRMKRIARRPHRSGLEIKPSRLRSALRVPRRRGIRR